MLYFYSRSFSTENFFISLITHNANISTHPKADLNLIWFISLADIENSAKLLFHHPHSFAFDRKLIFEGILKKSTKLIVQANFSGFCFPFVHKLLYFLFLRRY